MSESEPIDLCEQLAALGRSLGEREAAHKADLEAAWQHAKSLHEAVSHGIDAFHRGARDAGAPQLEVSVSGLRTDDKHLRSVEFDLERGRYKAVITVKSRGDVTLVGPFRKGKVEGPCKSFPFAATRELEQALGPFLQDFLEEAATP